MKTLFETGSFAKQSPAPLLMELGTEYCLLSKMDSETGQPLFARLWTFKEVMMEESLKQIGGFLYPENGQTEPVVVALAFPETVVLPEYSAANAPQLLNAVYPGHIGVPQYFANGKKFAFSVPHRIKEALEEQFATVRYLPAAACLPQAGSEPNSIHVFFVDHQIRVAVFKHQQLQLAQQYGYSAALDVVYYLLKICSEFGLSQQETLLSVSGFIEAGSALYKELHQYFLNIRFSLLETVQIDGQTFPKHYFTSLYNLAQCAL